MSDDYKILELSELSQQEKAERFDFIYESARSVYDARGTEDEREDDDHYILEGALESCFARDGQEDEFWDHWNDRSVDA
jgi:hypothetical protein